MADISQEIDDFKNAIYGEEVRDSMVSLAQKLNTEVEGNTTNVNQAVKTANSASSAANQAVQDANTTLQAANQAVQDANTTLQAANQAVRNAAGSASAAAGSASAAAGSAEDAAESATAASGSASAAAQSAANVAEVAEGLGGFTGAASSVTAQDVEGLLGSPGAQSNVQALIDYIADQVKNQLVSDSALTTKLAEYILKSQIINNLLATQAGNVLDAVQGKALSDMIGDTSQLPEGAENVVGAVAQLNSDIQPTSGTLSVNDKGSGTITYTKVANIVFLMLSNVSVTQKESPYTYIADLTHPPSGTLYQDCIDSQGIIFRLTLNSNGLGIQYTGDSSPYFYGIIAYTL